MITQMLTKKASLLICLGAISIQLFAQKNANFGMEFRAGIPVVVSSSPVLAPFGGVGVKYSFNQIFSSQIDIDGGALVGQNTNVASGYYRYHFIQPTLKVNVSLIDVIKKQRGDQEKWNVYAGVGLGSTLVFYDQDRSNSNESEAAYLNFNFGVSTKYYINEMLDFVAGVNFNFTGTTAIDNDRTGNNDVFMLPYIGLGVKFLKEERVQHADWKHLPLAFTSGPIAATKEIVGGMQKDIKANEAHNDSMHAVLQNQIAIVDNKTNSLDIKVDTIDAKLNAVLEILNKLNSGAAPTTNTNNNSTTVVAPKLDKNGKPVATPDTKPANNNTKPTTVIPKNQVIDPKNVKESYAIVVGSYLKDQNAIKAVERYTEKGWDAYMLGNPGSDLKRIVIFSNNYYEAAKIVTELRKTGQPDTWMLDINTGKGVYIK